MTSVEEGETPPEEVPAGNPDELTKNPAALKGKHFLFNYKSQHHNKCGLFSHTYIWKHNGTYI